MTIPRRLFSYGSHLHFLVSYLQLSRADLRFKRKLLFYYGLLPDATHVGIHYLVDYKFLSFLRDRYIRVKDNYTDLSYLFIGTLISIIDAQT